MKVLITGFNPFGGEKVNPSYEAIRLLPNMIAGAKIIKREIPTEFTAGRQVLEEEIENCRPDVVLCVGQAAGRSCVTIERVAINLADASIPDNRGEQPVDEPLQADGVNAYFATVPVKAMVRNVREHGIPCHISYSAGTYVCNCVMYHALNLAAEKYPGMRCGFIHVPYAAAQVVDKPVGTPFMTLEAIAKSIEYAIQAAAEE